MVPAVNNGFGSFSKTKSSNYSVTVSGSTSSGVDIVYEGYSRRNFASNNPVVKFAGFPWRHPSDYTRLCSRITYHGEPNFSNGVYHFKNKWWTSGDQQTWLNGYLGTTGVHCNPVVCQIGLDANAFNRVRTECLLKLKEGRVNLGVAIAEGKRTANMVADSASNLWRLLLAVKKGNFSYVQQYLGTKSIANGYLQWQYGWAPLAADVKGVFDLAQERTRNTDFITAKRTIRSNPYLEIDNAHFSGGGSVSMAHKCQLVARLSDSFLHNANSIGLVNPLSLAWELVPFSFVVDWSLPVGNYLEALTASAGLSFVGGFESQRCESTIHAVQVVPGFTGDMGSLSVDFFSYQRARLHDFPTPLPYVKSPFTTSHVKSALALLRQLLK